MFVDEEYNELIKLAIKEDYEHFANHFKQDIEDGVVELVDVVAVTPP